MASSSFQIGDVVRLKSGGPDMTVTYLGTDGQIQCEWYEGGQFAHHAFPPAALVKAEPK